jgi:uncharacterized protein (TIGR00290 family)
LHLNTREPIVLSWSGGKDSNLALAALRADPRYEVVALLTSITAGYDRVSIHGVRRELLEAQAQAVGLPLVWIELEPQCSNDKYESAFLSALRRLQGDYPQVRRVAFGDLYLADVREYRERLVEKAGYEGLFPLWGLDTRALASDFIESGFVAHLVCVDTEQLAGSFAGRPFDATLIADLPESVDPCGEGGEFHTFVSSGPTMSAAVPIQLGEIVLRDHRFNYCDLLPGGTETENLVIP